MAALAWQVLLAPARQVSQSGQLKLVDLQPGMMVGQGARLGTAGRQGAAGLGAPLGLGGCRVALTREHCALMPGPRGNVREAVATTRTSLACVGFFVL